MGDRVAFRDKSSPKTYRSTVLSKYENLATVFYEDQGLISIGSASSEIAQLTPSTQFPALALGFVDVPVQYAKIFRSAARKKVLNGNVKGHVTRRKMSPGLEGDKENVDVNAGEFQSDDGSNFGDLVVTLVGSDGMAFTARHWTFCVPINFTLNDVPRRPALTPGETVDGMVSHYAYPEPTIYCYAAEDVLFTAELTEKLVAAFPLTLPKRMPLVLLS